MFCTAAVADCATLCWLWWQVTWYTTMVGKKSTLGVALTALQALGVTCIRTNHFFQGHTIRWGVAWSYHPSAAFSPYYRRVVPELVEKSFTVSGKERRTGDSLAATPNAPPLYLRCNTEVPVLVCHRPIAEMPLLVCHRIIAEVPVLVYHRSNTEVPVLVYRRRQAWLSIPWRRASQSR